MLLTQLKRYNVHSVFMIYGGFKTQTLKAIHGNTEAKIIQYADDLTATLSDVESAEALFRVH